MHSITSGVLFAFILPPYSDFIYGTAVEKPRRRALYVSGAHYLFSTPHVRGKSTSAWLLPSSYASRLCRVLRQLLREVSLSRVRVFAVPVANWYPQLELSLSSFRRIVAYPLHGSSYRNVPVGLDIQFSRISEKVFSVLKNPLTDSEFQRGQNQRSGNIFLKKCKKISRPPFRRPAYMVRTIYSALGECEL